MRALVGVKRCLDYAIKVRVNQAKTGVELKGLKMSMNPFDEIAVEEALRMREQGKITEVVAISIGPKQ
jgi:electron transfer flavoprotein beta subunit